MHKSVLFAVLLVVSTTFLSACNGGEEKRPRAKVGALTVQETTRLRALNHMQQENIDAREYAKAKSFGPALSEKSKVMGEQLAEPHCIFKGGIPENEMNGSRHTQTIDGANCPIIWERTRHYNLTDKIMNVIDNLRIESNEYRKQFSPFDVRSLTGSYGLYTEGAGWQVYGRMTFNEFSTLEYGRLTGNILVSYKNSGGSYGTGAGSVTVELASPGRWGHSASISWTVRRGGAPAVSYRIDNFKVGKDDFNDLFSAYELDKFMDNALKMK